MGDSENNICNEVKPAVCVLLPVCVELESDVFLNILKNVVGRSRLDDHHLDALKAGMTADTFYIKLNDVLVNWKELDSKSQRFRQLKLLGFWSIKNYPALGKKLLGESWQAPQRKSVEVIGNSVMSADAIDDVIFGKMKLRIIELSVCLSTLVKLKHFVKTPINIGKFNGIQISPKMKSFEIEYDYAEICWNALKFGKFSMNEQPMHLSQPEHGRTRTEEHHRGISSGNSSQLLPIVKRLRLDVTNRTEERGSSGDGSQLMHSAEQSRLDGNIAEDSTIDSPRMVLLALRKEIGDLTKWFNPTRHNTEGPDMVLKQKDEEIAQIKASAEKLVKENEILNGHIKGNMSLINALQKGVDSSSKLYEILESSAQKQIQDLIKNVSKAEGINLEMSDKNVKLERELVDLKHYTASVEAPFQNQIQDLVKNLSEADRINLEMTDKNRKLEQEIVDLKHYNASVEAPFQNQIQDLVKTLSEAERINLEMTDKNRKLEQELVDLKHYNASVEASLQNQIQDLVKTLSKSERNNLEISDKNVKLERELVDLKHYTASVEAPFQNQIQDLVKNLSEAERINLEMSDKNRKLEQEIVDLKHYNASVGAPFQNQIQDLVKNLSEAERINLEMSDKNRKLEQKLVDLKHYNASVEASLQNRIQDLVKTLSKSERNNLEISDKNVKLERELVDSKNYTAIVEPPFQNQIQDLVKNLSEAEKINLEMSERVRKLDEEIDGWKNHAASKDKQLIEARKLEEELRSLKNNANTIMADFQNQIQNFDISLAEAEKTKFELTTKNEKLEEELKGWRTKENEAKSGEMLDQTSENKNGSEVFQTDDPIVQLCRENLLKLPFGWIKFSSHKNCKACPGFVYPPDSDGESRAQKIIANGYVSNSKNIFFQFDENMADNEKDRHQVAALNKFNQKFQTSFV